MKILLLVTLFLAGLVARGTEARIAAIISGTVLCTVRPDQGNLLLEINLSNGPSASINTTTTSEGQFMVVLNVTSSAMMDSLMSGSKVVVAAPTPAACNASLPAGVAAGTSLEAPVVPRGARILGATPVDNTLRDIIDDGYGVLSLHVYFRERFLFNFTMDNLLQLTNNNSLPAGVSYGGNTLDAILDFDIGKMILI
uniref:Uncharacterized protein n=1 Tax=Oryza punctata TaxID=4537 RepID=A0A0E0LPQ4_ORYPU